MLVEVGYVEREAYLDVEEDSIKTVYTFSEDMLQINIDHVIYSKEATLPISKKVVVEKQVKCFFGKSRTTKYTSYVYEKDMLIMKTVMSNGSTLYLTHDLEMLQQEEYRK